MKNPKIKYQEILDEEKLNEAFDYIFSLIETGGQNENKTN